MTPTTNSEAIQLAEVSDWKGLQRLIEKAPEYAQGMDEYGMLPIHWACTESHVPVALLNRLISAYGKGASMKNDAGLLPLHIAIRARVDRDWLEALIVAFPDAVHIQTPKHMSVLELAAQAGLSEESVNLLRNAIQNKNTNSSDTHNNNQDDNNNQILHKSSHENNHLYTDTPVSPAHSLRSVSSLASDSMVLLQDDEGPMISPSSNSSSTSHKSSHTAPSQTHPLPRSLPVPGPFQRKHSLDFHSHAAAAAAAARQHQEMMVLRNGGSGMDPHTAPDRLRPMLGGRHQSLPLIPSFEHVTFLPPHYERTQYDTHDDVSSEEGIDDDQSHILPAPLPARRSSFMIRRTGWKGASSSDRASLLHTSSRTFESPPEWKRSDECSICRASFGMFKHRHHCRNCGKSICSQHSADHKLLMEAKGFKTPQRVCVTCYAMIQHHSTITQRASEGEIKVERRRSVTAIPPPIMSYGSPQPHPTVHSLRTGGSLGTGVYSPTSKAQGTASNTTDTAADKRIGLIQTHMNDIRCLLQQQQQQIQQLTQTNLHLQQQLLEQEELKAETMLLITQLMTRVSMLELQSNTEEQEE